MVESADQMIRMLTNYLIMQTIFFSADYLLISKLESADYCEKAIIKLTDVMDNADQCYGPNCVK